MKETIHKNWTNINGKQNGSITYDNDGTYTSQRPGLMDSNMATSNTTGIMGNALTKATHSIGKIKQYD